MNKSLKLLVVIVTLFLLVSLSQVECRRTYSSRSSSSGRGNRGKNQSSGGGLFSSWFGGSKTGSGSSHSSSGSISKPAPSSAKKNWQTATSHTASQPKTNWANPYHKPAGAPAPSAPKLETNYGWKSTAVSNNKPGSAPYPSSNIGSRGYPVQSGVQTGSQSNLGGFKPAPQSNYHPSSSQHAPGHQTAFGGYHPAPSAANAGYNPANTYQPSHGYQPSHASVPHQSGYHPSPAQHAPSYHPSSVNHAPSYHPSSGYHAPSYPQQSYSSHHPSQSFSGYPSHSTFGSSVPSYQGNKLFGGNSGHYGYPSSGNWGVPTYGSRKSSGTGKLLTGLAVGAAGGYLTSSLVNSISNPWKYSGYGYGSRYGYDSGYGGLGLGSGLGYGLTRDQSAFERGYERGAQSRQNENNKETPAPAAPPPTLEDPTSKWVQCVAFDPQTQQTLINPNCSCTVTTSIDERTGQPLSVHHCTTLNGLVMQPVPFQQPYQGPNPLPSPGANFNGPPTGVNAPGAVPSYGNAYEANSQYGAGPGVYLPMQSDSKVERTPALVKSEGSIVEAVSEKGITDAKAIVITTEAKASETNKGTVTMTEPETIVPQNITNTESVTTKLSGSEPQSAAQTETESTGGLTGAQEDHKNTAEFYSRLQKIVNMGNFVDRL